MIQLKIYNDDKIRRWYGFPTLKDPYVLENTLAKVFSEYLGLNHLISFETVYRHLINLNTFFTYYSTSNFSSWGALPIQYIYNDMVRHIQNANTSNNFIMTLESIKIDEITAPNAIFNIVNDYISEAYMNSYSYLLGNCNGILVVYCKGQGNEVTAYIISVGFDPVKMSKWFSTSTFKSYIPYGRLATLQNIITSKPGIFTPQYGGDYWRASYDIEVNLECAEGRIREKLTNCEQFIEQYDISTLKKKSHYDTEVKYGNFDVDYRALSDIDKATAAMHYVYRDIKTGESLLLNKFNYECDEEGKMEYEIMKKQCNMIKIDTKKKSGVGY